MRDYDKTPLIIKNNFIMIMYGFAFLLVCNTIMIYIVFLLVLSIGIVASFLKF